MNTRMGHDMRLGQRFEVPGQPQVVDELAGRVLGRIQDLSSGGMKLVVAEPLVDETLYQVRFELPLEGGRRALIVAGLQVLEGREDASGQHCTSTRFIHMDGACARHIVHWLAMQAAG